ncbi:MAG: tRNA epoxyqueuosine(34) reductase QueG [Planctomycetota bacterium]|nr:tRNA epoxyqueuosine(34) reductase QueG [Planctomycetota bacterium]MDG2083467.1 tRNA epoxyqueuosine(34) reductase QueG [Planctomycetota bacterium]
MITEPLGSENSSLNNLDSYAREIGFHSLGVARADRSPHAEKFQSWIDSGMHADMEWLTRNTDRRLDPRKSLQAAKSIIMVNLPYSSKSDSPPTAPKIARYARGRDYHKVMKPMLQDLSNHISENGKWKTWYCVDASPILERDWAEISGLGWIGKNGLILNKEIGSWFFLGGIVTDRIFPVTQQITDHCGSCTRCLDACPTQAIVKPRTIDARKCISYWTIEHRGDLPADARLHNWLFGCDVCQEVCPWNTRPGRIDPPIHKELEPRTPPESSEQVIDATHEEWLEMFAGTPVTRTGFTGLKRNAQKIIQERNESPS